MQKQSLPVLVNMKPLYANRELDPHERPTFDHWYSADTPAPRQFPSESVRRTMTFAIDERTLGNSISGPGDSTGPVTGMDGVRVFDYHRTVHHLHRPLPRRRPPTLP